MRLIDLTHPLYDGGPCFPGDPPLSISSWSSIETDGYSLSSIHMGSHQGTHLDGLSHFLKDGKTVDQMPLEWFYGPASVIRLPKEPGSTIEADDLMVMPPADKILLDTGWGLRFGQPGFYEEFPSLSTDACQWIVERGVRLLGLDTPTPSRDYVEAHHILLGAGIVVVECLANLDQLPDRVVVAAFPLKIAGGDGSPVRAVALVP